jgi:hypothetical protein
MSLAILPKIENTKAASSLLFFIFILLYLLFVKSNSIPDMTNPGNIFGLIFLTTLVTGIVITIIGTKPIDRFQEFTVENLFYNNFKILVSNQIEFIRKDLNYKFLRDTAIAEFIFGLSIISIGLIYSNIGNEIISSLSGLTIVEVSSKTKTYVTAIIGLSGLIIIIKSFYTTKKSYLTIIHLLLLQNVQYQKNQLVTNILAKNNKYIYDRNWFGLYIEINKSLIKPILSELEILEKNYKKFHSLWFSKDQLANQENLLFYSAEKLKLFCSFFQTDYKIGNTYQPQNNFVDQSLSFIFEVPRLYGELEIGKTLFNGKNPELFDSYLNAKLLISI